MKLCIQTKRQSDKIMRKKIYKYLPFLFIAVLSGSTFGVEKHPEDRTIAYQSCPAKTFEDFAVLFSNNVDFQRAYTHFPLKKMEVDDSGEELKTIINLKNKEQISFPVIPNEAERENKEFNNIFFQNLNDTRKLLSNYNYNKNLQYNNFNNIINDINI